MSLLFSPLTRYPYYVRNSLPVVISIHVTKLASSGGIFHEIPLVKISFYNKISFRRPSDGIFHEIPLVKISFYKKISFRRRRGL